MKDVPIWEKSNLTLEEAAAYSGIGINKLRSLSDKELVSSCCGWVPSGSSSGASWMNTRSECTRFENVPDIFQNVLQKMAYLWYYKHRTTLFSVPQCRKEHRSWQQIRIRNARTRRVWFSAKGNPSAKMASTISVGLPPDGKRHSIYAATLEELREKEKDIQLDSLEGIKQKHGTSTLNDVFTPDGQR